MIFLLAACTGASTVPDSTPPDSGEAPVVRHGDLAYDPAPGVESDLATLDLWAPEWGSRRLVLLVHGGSWVSGDKSNFETAPDFVPWWLGQGYSVAALNFRLASPLGQEQTVTPLDQVRDIAHALAWLADHEDAYHLDTTGVVALGYSSGAHLVALLGADGSWLEEAGLAETHVGATVSLDVHAYDVPYALALMVDSVYDANIPLIEHLFGETEGEQLTGSPSHFVDGHVAPALLVSVEPALEDPTTHGGISGLASERYAQALVAAGHTATWFHDEAETHESMAMGFGADGDLVTGSVEEFLAALP